jgi:hypothetical protein
MVIREPRLQLRKVLTSRALRFAAASMFLTAAALPAQQHFAFFNRDRQALRDPRFLDNPVFSGAQVKYTWRELERVKDHYDFTPVVEDVALLADHHKRLFIQLQDSSFDDSIINVPEYLLHDPDYHGGANRENGGGWVARRWDPAVRSRFEKLLNALGTEVDGEIAGITLPETSVGYGGSGKVSPSGFTFETYRDGVLETMTALKRAFPKSVAMIYANFMPGEWLPSQDHGYLRSVYDHAGRLGLAVGGPDLLPFRRGQMNHPYHFMHEGHLITAIAVQEGNYEVVNPKTNRRVTIAEMADFARNYLHVTYMFWFIQEPFFSRDVVPFLRRRH